MKKIIDLRVDAGTFMLITWIVVFATFLLLSLFEIIPISLFWGMVIGIMLSNIVKYMDGLEERK